MRKLVNLVVVVVALSGCSLHYTNQKGIKAKGDDIITKIGTIQDANTYFASQVDLWIPVRPKESESVCVECYNPNECTKVDCKWLIK